MRKSRHRRDCISFFKAKYFGQKFQFLPLLKQKYANVFSAFYASTDENLHDKFQMAWSAGKYFQFLHKIGQNKISDGAKCLEFFNVQREIV